MRTEFQAPQNGELGSLESAYYSESGIAERNIFAGRLLRIMEKYCYKVNHIPKGYVSGMSRKVCKFFFVRLNFHTFA